MLSAILRDAAVKAEDADLGIRVTPNGFVIHGSRVIEGRLFSYRHVLTFTEGSESILVWEAAICRVAHALARGAEEDASQIIGVA